MEGFDDPEVGVDVVVGIINSEVGVWVVWVWAVWVWIFWLWIVVADFGNYGLIEVFVVEVVPEVVEP